MGCDIHMFTERKSEIDGHVKWSNVDNWKYNRYYTPDNEDGEPQMEINSVYRDRNYRLFATLAGVRDYSDNTEMVDEPRGFPCDASPQVKEEYGEWGCDGHTPSWFTFRELKEFAKEHTTTTHKGLVSLEGAKRLDEYGIPPDSWCQGTSDPTYVWRTWTVEGGALDGLMEALTERFKDEFWLFGTSYEDGRYNPEIEDEFRIVFWFDN